VGTLSWGRILIGFVLGAMVGFDMGGPINKIAVATATSLILVDSRLMGGVAAAIPIAPLGCGFASVVLGRRSFTEEERGLGISALALGFMGISEGAIPFATRRLKQTFIANIIGSAVAGGLSCLFCVGGHVGMWGGMIIAFTMGIYSPAGTAAPFAWGHGGATFPNALITVV
jgi:PTS system fructose-specific IIC component